LTTTIKAASAIAALVLIASATGAEAAERSTRASVPRRITNPFAMPRTSRLTADRFGLPILVSEPVFAKPVTLTSPALTTRSVTATPVSAPVPAPTAPTPSPTVETLEEELVFTPMSSTTRPPYRPAVRSPFRPPPRPPF
jgi:hypothetical protein